MEYIFDLETDGLLKDLTKIHCAVFASVTTNEIHRFYNDNPFENFVYSKDYDKPLEELQSFVETIITERGTLIGHNIISFDCRVLRRFYGLDLGRLHMQGKIKLIDTLVMSGCLHPDRQLPRDCPTSIEDPLTGRLQRIGPHSLEAWGFRLGNFKIHHHDWQTFSQQMLDRCTQDVLLNKDVYYALLKEAKLSHGDL